MHAQCSMFISCVTFLEASDYIVVKFTGPFSFEIVHDHLLLSQGENNQITSVCCAKEVYSPLGSYDHESLFWLRDGKAPFANRTTRQV